MVRFADFTPGKVLAVDDFAAAPAVRLSSSHVQTRIVFTEKAAFH